MAQIQSGQTTSSRIPPLPDGPLPVAISSCLLEHSVRYDGGHKKSAMPHDDLQGLFDYQPICPEIGIGMGVPREPIRLIGHTHSPRAVGVKDSSLDVTDQLAALADSHRHQIDTVDGYVFMKNSPSCGLHRVKVYQDSGIPEAAGRGIFASRVTVNHPNLPVEESGRLHDPVLRENFATRVCAHAHWRSFMAYGLTPAGLIEFHSVYKYLVMAHSVRGYRRLGRMLSDLSGDLESLAQRYFTVLMRSLQKPATRRGHANVMSHLQGHVKKHLPGSARQELNDLIGQYRTGDIPLLAPLVLLKHHLTTAEASYALGQQYLQTHPAATGLRRLL